MSLVLRCLLVTVLVSTLTNAESLVELGLQGAMNSLKSVPPQTTKSAEATATKLLQTYLRPTQGGFYLRYKGSTGKWGEVKDLRFQRISLGTITNADRANGVSDRLVISLTAEMHRTQTSSQAWSEWQYGMPGFLPRALQVERKNGQWSASSIILSLLEPCNDQPISIPSSIVAMPIAKASPPVTHQPVAKNITPKVPSHPAKPPAPTKSLSQAASSLIIGAIISLLLTILGLVSFVYFLKFLFYRWKRQRARPPQLPRTSPPALPARDQSIDLIEARTFLMTEAEQKFFAVLQPLVTPRYHISSKVRLADIFDVLYAPGRQAAFNKICSKHIDFVLTEPGTSRIICGIELDDNTHQRPDRIERDTFVNELFASKNLPLLRIPWARHYDPESLRKSLNLALGKALAA